MGEGLSASQGLGEGSWRALVRALEHYRMSSPVESLGPPAHPLAQGWVIPKPSNRMLNLPLLTFQLMTTKPPFLNHFLNTPFLTVSEGQGPLWCWSIAEQDKEWSLIDSWLLVNGVIWGTKQGWATPVAQEQRGLKWSISMAYCIGLCLRCSVTLWIE